MLSSATSHAPYTKRQPLLSPPTANASDTDVESDMTCHASLPSPVGKPGLPCVSIWSYRRTCFFLGKQQFRLYPWGEYTGLYPRAKVQETIGDVLSENCLEIFNLPFVVFLLPITSSSPLNELQDTMFMSHGSLWAGKGKLKAGGATSGFPMSPDRWATTVHTSIKTYTPRRNDLVLVVNLTCHSLQQSSRIRCLASPMFAQNGSADTFRLNFLHMALFASCDVQLFVRWYCSGIGSIQNDVSFRTTFPRP